MADKKSLLIVITPQDIHPDEAKYIAILLDEGATFVHLRHPGATYSDMKRLIEAIPQRYHSRLRLHGHFELLNEFNLGGIHLNSRCPQAPQLYNGSVSRTCHSVEEVNEAARNVDFVTLSPVCDSISKAHYKRAFTHGQLSSLPIGKVVALGGITPENISVLKQYPFIGYAVLGYIWSAQTADELKQRLYKLTSVIS